MRASGHEGETLDTTVLPVGEADLDDGRHDGRRGRQHDPLVRVVHQLEGHEEHQDGEEVEQDLHRRAGALQGGAKWGANHSGIPWYTLFSKLGHGRMAGGPARDYVARGAVEGGASGRARAGLE